LSRNKLYICKLRPKLIHQIDPQELKTTSSVFGISGKNSVKVETSNYNYNYETK
jgi:hypothetical protein